MVTVDILLDKHNLTSAAVHPANNTRRAFGPRSLAELDLQAVSLLPALRPSIATLDPHLRL